MKWPTFDKYAENQIFLNQFAITPVLSCQNDTKLENGELATDLISAIKEFEETTAKITSAHSYQNDQNYQEYQTANKTTTESMIEHQQIDEKGPIEYFNRTKETLRHVEQINHHNDRNNSNRIYHEARLTEAASALASAPANDHQYENNDSNELEDDYVKIPVQQLINTFEKQMRSIIKQKINENIQLKLDGSSTANSNRNSAAYNTVTATNLPPQLTTTATPPTMTTIRDNDRCDIVENGKRNGIEHENEFNQLHHHQYNEYDAMAYASRQKTIDFNSMVCQQYQQTATKQIAECNEMTQSTIVESASNRFSNSNETKVDVNFDGGKAQKAIYNKSYPFCITVIYALMSL